MSTSDLKIHPSVLIACFQQGMTLQEIAAIYGVSRERIRQIAEFHGILEDGHESRRVLKSEKIIDAWLDKNPRIKQLYWGFLESGVDVKIVVRQKYQKPVFFVGEERVAFHFIKCAAHHTSPSSRKRYWAAYLSPDRLNIVFWPDGAVRMHRTDKGKYIYRPDSTIDHRKKELRRKPGKKIKIKGEK